MNKAKLALPLLFVMAGCTTAPYAVLDGGYKVPTDPHNYEVRIKAIDGQYLFSDNVRKNITPGEHVLVLETTKTYLGRVEKSEVVYPMVAQACTRYRLSAQHQSTMSNDWQVKLIEATDIPSCDK